MTTLLADNELLISARNGLNIRSDITLNSDKIGKFNYAEQVKVMEKTGVALEVTDNGGNYQRPRVASGYVFSDFLIKPKQKILLPF